MPRFEIDIYIIINIYLVGIRKTVINWFYLHSTKRPGNFYILCSSIVFKMYLLSCYPSISSHWQLILQYHSSRNVKNKGQILCIIAGFAERSHNTTKLETRTKYSNESRLCATFSKEKLDNCCAKNLASVAVPSRLRLVQLHQIKGKRAFITRW